MGELDDFVGFTIMRDLTNTNLNNSQLHLINKMTQGFNKDMKSLMTFNNPDKTDKRIVHN